MEWDFGTQSCTPSLHFADAQDPDSTCRGKKPTPRSSGSVRNSQVDSELAEGGRDPVKRGVFLFGCLCCVDRTRRLTRLLLFDSTLELSVSLLLSRAVSESTI